MSTPDELRKQLDLPHLSDEEITEFAQELDRIILRFLDEYFQEEFLPDEV